MARIAGVDIPRDKRVVVSLTYIYGIGLTTSKNILKECGISEVHRLTWGTRGTETAKYPEEEKSNEIP